MGKSGCSVFGCKARKEDSRHRFPNPNTKFKQFTAWKRACNSPTLAALTNEEIHKGCYICDRHFRDNQKTRKNHLLPGIAPTLFIAEVIKRSAWDHDYVVEQPKKQTMAERCADKSESSQNNYLTFLSCSGIQNRSNHHHPDDLSKEQDDNSTHCNDISFEQIEESQCQLVQEGSQQMLPENIRSLLQSSRDVPNTTTPLLHKDLTSCWTKILSGGLAPSIRSALVDKYPIPANCPTLLPPSPNKEVQIKDSKYITDNKIKDSQNQLGSALAGIGKAIMCASEKHTNKGKGRPSDMRVILEALTDSARLIADCYWQNSRQRREPLSSHLREQRKNRRKAKVRSSYYEINC